MIGYGLLNSKIQEFCLGGIINSFLNRSAIYLCYSYINYGIKNESDKEKIINSLYNIFIQEELRLSPRVFKNFETFKNGWEDKINPIAVSNKPEDLIFAYYIDDSTKKIIEVKYTDKGFDSSVPLAEDNFERYSDLIIKYILSANVAQDKDYDFSNKTIEQTKEDGKKNLKILFKNNFEEFYYGKYFGGSKQDIKPIKDWPKYYESVKKFVYDFFINIYNNVIDLSEDNFLEWWKASGNDFINSLSAFVSATSENNLNKTDDIQKIKLFKDVINKLKVAREKFPNFIDELDDAPIIAPYTLSGNEIIPTDISGKQIELKKSWTDFDSGGDIALKTLLEYFNTILQFYDKKITEFVGVNFIENTISDSIKEYIKFVILNNTSSDSLETTLNNMSIYFVEKNGYLKNINKIISFYKEKKLLSERSFYLRLLTEQINSLQTIKIDEYEKYIGI
jgi:hypothetical protein